MVEDNKQINKKIYDLESEHADSFHTLFTHRLGNSAASFLYWVDSKQDCGTFESTLRAEPSRVDLWLGAHTHTNPDDTYGGKSHIEQKWGTTFINAAGLTRYHSDPGTGVPRSWLLTFTDGSDEVSARCFLHGNEYATQGWYPKADRVIKLSKTFKMPIGK